MHINCSSKISAALAALFLSLSGSAFAAVPVEESVEEPRTEGASNQRRQTQPLVKPSSRRAPPLDIPPTIEPGIPATIEPDQPQPQVVNTSGATSASGDEGSLSNLFYQLQLLQQEIQSLRGQVEEQGYQLNRLQQEQKEQYLDLDRRVAGLSNGSTRVGATPATTNTQSSATPAQPSSNSNSTATTSTPANERDAYRQAFDAMRNQQFDASLGAFKSLIERYPNGQYTPNAFYWIGEIFLVANQDAEQARQSFMQVVNLYPDHQKTPDALYKLGVVHATMGENDMAKRFLDRVQREHPDSSAAGLARKYASELP